MAYWLYSFKKYFSVIAISQPKSESVKAIKVTEDPTVKGDGCVKGDSRQYRISSSDNAVLGYCDVWQDWMLETLTDMQKLRKKATSEVDFNRLSFAQEMVDRIRNVKSEIVNAQGVLCCYKKSAQHQKIRNLLPSVRHQLDNLQNNKKMF